MLIDCSGFSMSPEGTSTLQRETFDVFIAEVKKGCLSNENADILND